MLPSIIGTFFKGWRYFMKPFREFIGKNMDGDLPKIDVEKVSDKVKWSSLQQTLYMKDFLP